MRTEKTLWLVVFIGLVFKFLLWPGGNILLSIAFLAIMLLCFPAGFYFFCDKNIKRQNLVLSIISGLFLALIPGGILFKVMYWPGGQPDLVTGTVAASILFAIAFILKSKSSDDLKTYYRNMLLRTGVLAVLGTFFYFIPTSTLLKIQYRNDPELARLKILYYSNPNNEEYKKQHDSYVLRLDSIQHEKTVR